MDMGKPGRWRDQNILNIAHVQINKGWTSFGPGGHKRKVAIFFQLGQNIGTHKKVFEKQFTEKNGRSETEKCELKLASYAGTWRFAGCMVQNMLVVPS